MPNELNLSQTSRTQTHSRCKRLLSGDPQLSDNTMRYIAVQCHIKVSAIDWHAGLLRWSRSVRRRISCEIDMDRLAIVHVN